MDALAKCFLEKMKVTGALLTAFLLFIAALCWTVSPVFAVDDETVFELEKNANAVDEAPAGDDWENIEDGSSSAIATTKDPDGTPVGYPIITDLGTKTIFTGGGSKDDEDTTQWLWKNGHVPDKTNLSHGFAAAYEVGGEILLFFGSDRRANNGDAQVGFWFFQDVVGPQGVNSGNFGPGKHKNGDVLVQANFTNGGKVATVTAYVWDDTQPNNLMLLPDTKQCGDFTAPFLTPGDDIACASTNATEQASPWTYSPKFGTDEFFPPQSLFEGGINLTAIFGEEVPCFSSFMATSRSSTPFDAVLKDFVFGEFKLCSVEISKTCEVTELTTDFNSPEVDFWKTYPFKGTTTITVTNGGPGSFPAGSVLTIEDVASQTNGVVYVEDPLGVFTKFFDANDEENFPGEVTLVNPDHAPLFDPTIPDPMSNGETFVKTLVFFTKDNPPDNTANVTVNIGSASGPDINATIDPDPLTCEDLPINGAINLDKECDGVELALVSGMVVAKVNVTLDVCNYGDVPVSVDLLDTKVGVNETGIILDAGVSCAEGDDASCNFTGECIANICGAGPTAGDACDLDTECDVTGACTVVSGICTAGTVDAACTADADCDVVPEDGLGECETSNVCTQGVGGVIFGGFVCNETINASYLPSEVSDIVGNVPTDPAITVPAAAYFRNDASATATSLGVSVTVDADTDSATCKLCQ